MPLYDLIRQVREFEACRWVILQPIANEMRWMAEQPENYHLAIQLRSLADRLDP